VIVRPYVKILIYNAFDKIAATDGQKYGIIITLTLCLIMLTK